MYVCVILTDGFIYSGLYSCSLGYVREFLLLFLHCFSIKFDYFEGGCCCFFLDLGLSKCK